MLGTIGMHAVNALRIAAQMRVESPEMFKPHTISIPRMNCIWRPAIRMAVLIRRFMYQIGAKA